MDYGKEAKPIINWVTNFSIFRNRIFHDEEAFYFYQF